MEHKLDVSDLEPCEPMERILAAITVLGVGDYLRVRHRREPRLLYPMLQQQGFAWETRLKGDSEVELCIWRQNDLVAADAVRGDPQPPVSP